MKCPFELPVSKELMQNQATVIDGKTKLFRIKPLLIPYTEEEADYIVQAINSRKKLEEALAWLLEEYHFFSRKMTEINNIVQPLWGELRERRNDYQLIEDFVEQIKEKGLEQALEMEKKE